MAKIRPYKGGEPYIFISYAHEDSDTVLSFLEAMSREGYRFWYDKGIQAGARWKNAIATHIEKCETCIVFYSSAAKSSRHCDIEMNYIADNDKTVILFYLEDVPLSPGLRMYLGSLQSVKRAEYPTPEAFIELLKETESFQPCRGQSEAERREREDRERREREARTQSPNAQSEVSASSESLSRLLIDGDLLPPSASNGDFLSPSAPSAETGTNETLESLPRLLIDGDLLPPSATSAETGTDGTLESLPRLFTNGDCPSPSVTGGGAGTKKARKRFPKIRAIYVNGVWRFTGENATPKFLSIAEATRMTFQAVFNDYLGPHPAPYKTWVVETFIEEKTTFLRFEAVNDAQFAARAPLYLNGFPSPVYLATKNDTPMKRNYVMFLCRYLDANGQESRVEWRTTDGNIWRWRSGNRYEMESVSDSGS